MIYQILKILCKLTISSYFRRVKITGKENIPDEGPFIFVANHPSAFMDPVVVGTVVKPQLYFIAAGEYVGTGFKAWFFKKALHMIPVFRPDTRPDEVFKNQNMFDKCHEHLINHGSLLVFPEGASITERSIKPLKTGVARIARGAELQKQLKLGIKIVPIGLNYSDPHEFRSDLFVNIEKPILASDFFSDDPDKEKEEVRALTEEIENRMKDSVLHIKHEDEGMLAKLDEIYSRDLKKELGIEFQEQEREFLMHKDMISAISYFKENDVDRYDRIERKIDTYLASLYEFGIRDRDIQGMKQNAGKMKVMIFILGFPVYVIGLINNVLPYVFVRFLINRLNIKGTFVGSIILATGLFSYLFWYALVTAALIIFTPLKWYALFYPIVMYITGVYTLIYKTAVAYSKERRNLRNFIRKDEEASLKLAEQRNEIITELNEARSIFEQNVKEA